LYNWQRDIFFLMALRGAWLLLGVKGRRLWNQVLIYLLWGGGKYVANNGGLIRGGGSVRLVANVAISACVTMFTLGCKTSL